MLSVGGAQDSSSSKARVSQPRWPTTQLAEGYAYPAWARCKSAQHVQLSKLVIRGSVLQSTGGMPILDTPPPKHMSLPMAYVVDMIPGNDLRPPGKNRRMLVRDSETDTVLDLRCQIYYRPGLLLDECDPTMPTGSCWFISWSGPDPSTGMYPNKDEAGQPQEITLDSCWDCVINGKDCGKAGMIMYGPNKNKYVSAGRRRIRTINEMLGLAARYSILSPASRKAVIDIASKSDGSPSSAKRKLSPTTDEQSIKRGSATPKQGQAPTPTRTTRSTVALGLHAPEEIEVELKPEMTPGRKPYTRTVRASPLSGAVSGVRAPESGTPATKPPGDGDVPAAATATESKGEPSRRSTGLGVAGASRDGAEGELPEVSTDEVAEQKGSSSSQDEEMVETVAIASPEAHTSDARQSGSASTSQSPIQSSRSEAVGDQADRRTLEQITQLLQESAARHLSKQQQADTRASTQQGQIEQLRYELDVKQAALTKAQATIGQLHRISDPDVILRLSRAKDAAEALAARTATERDKAVVERDKAEKLAAIRLTESLDAKESAREEMRKREHAEELLRERRAELLALRAERENAWEKG